MRPSNLSKPDLKTLFEKLGINKFRKQKTIIRMEREQQSYDYIFERVIFRRGHFYMHWKSLKEWEKHHPRMIEKLRAKGVYFEDAFDNHIRFYTYKYRRNDSD